VRYLKGVSEQKGDVEKKKLLGKITPRMEEKGGVRKSNSALAL